LAIVCRYCWWIRSQSCPNACFHFSDKVWGIICSIVISFSDSDLTTSCLSLLSLFSKRSRINIRALTGILYTWRVQKSSLTSSSVGNTEDRPFFNSWYVKTSIYEGFTPSCAFVIIFNASLCNVENTLFKAFDGRLHIILLAQ